MPFTFEPAGEAELDTALAIARAASESPFSHWDAEYPNREILGEDIAVFSPGRRKAHRHDLHP